MSRKRKFSSFRKKETTNTAKVFITKYAKTEALDRGVRSRTSY